MFVWSTYIQSHIWSFSWPSYIGLHLKVKSRSQTFQGVVSHKWYIIWAKLYEIHIIRYGLSVYLLTFHPWWNGKGKSRSLGFQLAIFQKLSTFWPYCIRNTFRKSSMNYQFTSRHLTLDNLSRSNQGHMMEHHIQMDHHIKCCMKHIYNKSYNYDISVYLVTSDLGSKR